MEETKNGGDPPSDEQPQTPDKTPDTLFDRERCNKKYQTEAHDEARHNAKGKPLPMPLELEQLISTIRRFVLFVRDHNTSNAFVVVLTFVIAFASLGQVVASLLEWDAIGNQLEVIRRQMTDSEDAQSANLVMNKFECRETSTGPKFSAHCHFDLVNDGPSAAEQINIHDGGLKFDNVKNRADPDLTEKPSPNPNGQSVASHSPLPYDWDGGDGLSAEYLDGNARYNFYIWINVSYVDIFKRPHILHECIQYRGWKSGYQHQWMRCYFGHGLS